MDESKDGVVYFSMGSLLNAETFSPSILAAIFSSFGKIAPVRVLMKGAINSTIDAREIPRNVKILPWLPQV